MKFIDRIEEQHILHKALDNKERKFIVVYGRRRLGKSTLIKRVLKENDVYYEAEKNEQAVQMSLLAHTVNASYPHFDAVQYLSWEGILMNFNLVCKENSTLVLDEFPFLVEKTPSLPSTLQRLLDSGELRFNLIICGSSQRMMQKIVLDSSEPLYGRAHEKINLQPIRLKYWHKAMKWNAVNSIEEFSVWGGVPRYWALREEYDDLTDAIDHLILDEHGVLYDEPAALFMDDISEIAPYASIMTALGNGNNRFSNVANAVGKKTTELSKPLNNLSNMGYIRKEVPFGENEKKTKKTIYRIDDPFMSFYYRFIAPNKSLLSLGRKQIVLDTIHTEMPEHVSFIWERLCQIAVSGNTLFGHTWNVARRWWGKVPIFDEGKKTPIGYEDLEFDVVAEDFNNPSTILVGECKWKSADYADRLLQQLKTKTQKAPFSQGKKIVYVLFLKEHPLVSADCSIMLPENVIDCLP